MEASLKFITLLLLAVVHLSATACVVFITADSIRVSSLWPTAVGLVVAVLPAIALRPLRYEERAVRLAAGTSCFLAVPLALFAGYLAYVITGIRFW